MSTKNIHKCQCKNPTHGKSVNEPHISGCSITFEDPLHDFTDGYLCLWCDKGCKSRGLT